MPRFKHYSYDQDAMVVINYQNQLQPGTFGKRSKEVKSNITDNESAKMTTPQPGSEVRTAERQVRQTSSDSA